MPTENQLQSTVANFPTGRTPAIDHLINILKAGLSIAPFCGGIASLMSDYIPTQRAKRLDRFAEQVARDLNALADQVETNRIQTEEYAIRI